MSEEEKKKLDDKSLLTLDEIQDQRKKEVEAFQLADRLTGACSFCISRELLKAIFCSPF